MFVIPYFYTTQVTVLVRSMLLRGFDRDIVEKIQTHMEAAGTRVLVGVKPVSVDKVENGQLKVRRRGKIIEGTGSLVDGCVSVCVSMTL